MDGINLDAPGGVLIRKHRASNMKVFMYLAEPGVYLNVHGGPVPEKIAEMAGFDTVRYAKMKWKRDRMSEFEKQMQAQIDAEEAAMGAAAPEKVIAERGGFKIVAAALGAANVVDADGQKLNDKPITVDAAHMLLDHMAPEETGEDTPEE